MNEKSEWSSMLKELAQSIVGIHEKYRLSHGVNYKACAEVNGKKYLVRTRRHTGDHRDRTLIVEVEELPSL